MFLPSFSMSIGFSKKEFGGRKGIFSSLRWSSFFILDLWIRRRRDRRGTVGRSRQETGIRRSG